MVKKTLTVFFALRETSDIERVDLQIFSLFAESRYVQIKLIFLIAPKLEPELLKLQSIAHKHRFDENSTPDREFRYIVLPEADEIRRSRILSDFEVTDFVLMDADRIYYTQSLRKLTEALAAVPTVDALFGGFRVARADSSSNLAIASKEHFYGEIREAHELMCTSYFLDFGAAIYSAAFLSAATPIIHDHLLKLEFDQILQLALTRNQFSLALYATPLMEIIVLSSSVSQSHTQLQLAQRRRIITSLEFEINRLRKENFTLATERNSLIQADKPKHFLNRARAIISKAKSLFS